MMKSKTFHGMVKYLKFNAISFIAHSTVNLNNTRPGHHQTVKLDLHGNEEVIDVSEDAVVGITLIVMFETHAEHIEKNTDHDKYVELLVRR